MALLPEQVQQLLQPINPKRVLSDGKGHSHVSQQDILAHLIRVFGFGSFDIDVLETDCLFETEREKAGRFDVCYRALVRLTVRDPESNELCHFENGSTATAQNQTRGDAHDLAYKSAISLSVKRCAICLGDQFGLSLYNKGQLEALVRGTLVAPSELAHDGEDIQADVPEQVALGNDEADVPLEAAEPEPAKPAAKKADPDSMAGLKTEFARFWSAWTNCEPKVGAEIKASLGNAKTKADCEAAYCALSEADRGLLMARATAVESMGGAE